MTAQIVSRAIINSIRKSKVFSTNLELDVDENAQTYARNRYCTELALLTTCTFCIRAFQQKKGLLSPPRSSVPCLVTSSSALSHAYNRHQNSEMAYQWQLYKLLRKNISLLRLESFYFATSHIFCSQSLDLLVSSQGDTSFKAEA